MEAMKQHLLSKAKVERVLASDARSEAERLRHAAAMASGRVEAHDAVAAECERLAGLYPVMAVDFHDKPRASLETFSARMDALDKINPGPAARLEAAVGDAGLLAAVMAEDMQPYAKHVGGYKYGSAVTPTDGSLSESM